MPKAVNKSQAIRDLLQAHQDMPAKAVVAALAKRGIKVHENLVYNVKANGVKKPQPAKPHESGPESNGEPPPATEPVNEVELAVSLLNSLADDLDQWASVSSRNERPVLAAANIAAANDCRRQAARLIQWQNN